MSDPTCGARRATTGAVASAVVLVRVVDVVSLVLVVGTVVVSGLVGSESRGPVVDVGGVGDAGSPPCASAIPVPLAASRVRTPMTPAKRRRGLRHLSIAARVARSRRAESRLWRVAHVPVAWPRRC